MVRANSDFDAWRLIRFAKSRMGTALQTGTLANAFASASEASPGKQYPNFWQVGCVFDTILDYFLVLKESGEFDDDDRQLMQQLMAQAVTGYQYGIVGLAAAWYDDWSWWGIAASKAFDPDYEDIFGDQIGFFQSAALDLWGLVDAGEFAPVADSIPDDVWALSAVQSDGTRFTKSILSARSELHAGTRNAWNLILRGANESGTPRQKADYQQFTFGAAGMWASPRFPGGCWQYDLSTSSFSCDDGPDWQMPDPNGCLLGVFQVTLMSGLYLSFACSLMAAANRKAAEARSGKAWDRLQTREAYRQPAEEVAGFLTDWLEAPPPDSLATQFPHGVLVHERTPTYARLSKGSYPAVEGYHADAYWGGDQGLIMGALKQYAQLVGGVSAERSGETTPPIFTTYPMLLLQGAFYNLPSDLWAGAVGPYLDPSGNSPISEDVGDYGSGSGIFWRYVLRCCRLDPAFKAAASADPAIVDVAINSGAHFNCWGNDLFRPFNTVAAAIGAFYLLK
jgi:hypothetical protein